MSNLAIVKSQVDDMWEMLTANQCEIPIDPEKCDYGFYGNHMDTRPYASVMEGVSWYLGQPEISYLPDELVLSLVAHNFGISVEEAAKQIETEIDISSAGLIEFV